jgi:hypothetical protein
MGDLPEKLYGDDGGFVNEDKAISKWQLAISRAGRALGAAQRD